VPACIAWDQGNMEEAVLRVALQGTGCSPLVERRICVPHGCFLAELVMDDEQNVSSSSYLFAEDVMESAHLSASCQRIYPAESGLIWMVVFRFLHILVGFVLPRLVILVCYCIIICSLSQGAKGQVLKKKKKSLKMTVILIVCLFGCWLPYCVGIVVDTLMMPNIVMSPSCELQQAVEMWICITEALAYFHCCLKPILYAFLGVMFNQTARSTGQRTISPLSLCESVFSPDSSGSSNMGPYHPPSPSFYSTYSLCSSSRALSPSEILELSTSHEEIEEKGEGVVDSTTGPVDEVDAEA
ncbi:hypothetical protein GOODEAATRI_025052, partial [Goodea atripinnis]